MKTWVVQSSGITDYETKKVMDTCLELNIPYKDVGLIPFTDTVVGIENLIPEEDYIFYGSTKLIKLIQNSPFKDGIFYNENFNVKTWIENRDDMLNSDSIIMTVDEFLRDRCLTEDYSEWFVRPLNDLKDFDGTIVEDRYAWYEEKSYNGTAFNRETKIAIAPLKEIIEEYRAFVVRGKVVSASRYKRDGRLSIEKCNLGLERAIADCIAGWLPHENVVVDVCATVKGNKIIEFNCLNASGFYANDVEKILKSL